MTELPKGWARAQFNDVALVASDLVDPASWPDLPHVAPNHIESGTGRLSGVTTVAEDGVRSPKHRFRAGQVLYSKIRPYLAKAALAPYAGLCSADMYPIDAFIESRYLLHWMLSDDFTGFAAAHQGRSVLPKINQAALATLPVPVAPLPEQQRIVESIEEAFSQLDAGEAGLRTVRHLLKRMRGAILVAAVTGRLGHPEPNDTPASKLLADLGVEPLPSDLPRGWALTRLGDAFRVAVGTTPSRRDPSLWGGDVSWVSSGEVAFNRIHSTRETITSKAVEGRGGRVVPAGTVMLAMIGEGKTRGQPAILDIPAAHNQNCASIRVDGTGVSSEWMFTFLASRYEETRRASSGNNQSALNKQRIEAIEVPLPPPEAQRRIVAEVDRQLSFLDACEHAVDNGMDRAAALRRSVLKSAFEGRLVVQDPTDEPASVLLDRIQASRPATKPGRRARATA